MIQISDRDLLALIHQKIPPENFTRGTYNLADPTAYERATCWVMCFRNYEPENYRLRWNDATWGIEIFIDSFNPYTSPQYESALPDRLYLDMDQHEFKDFPRVGDSRDLLVKLLKEGDFLLTVQQIEDMMALSGETLSVGDPMADEKYQGNPDFKDLS
jgi:hypothetical protein